VIAFGVERGDGAPLVVLWTDGDMFSGEDEATTVVEWRWPHDQAVAVDAFGAGRPCELHDGRLVLELSVTPVFVSGQ
jgi:hypothetical protein